MNLDALLAPVSEESPCGPDLSFSAEFDAIQELRRADDPTLDQGDWVTALKLADWPGVVRQCSQALSEHSKDLRLAAWLTEASARTSGYAGLADGLTLCRLLCERYWDDLHPRLDDGDAEQRSGNLRWLLIQLEDLAPRLPVLRNGARTFSLQDIASVQAASRIDAGTPPAGAISADDITAARNATPHEFLAANLADARRAQQTLDELQQLIDQRLGADGPGFAAVKGALANAVHGIERLARDGDPLAATDDDSGTDDGTVNTATDGPLRTRADALRQLRAVAQFFRRTEPHSPVAYLAERAAQWGDMPLHAWLRSVVKDQTALSHMEELLGIPQPPSAAE